MGRKIKGTKPSIKGNKNKGGKLKEAKIEGRTNLRGLRYITEVKHFSRCVKIVKIIVKIFKNFNC